MLACMESRGMPTPRKFFLDYFSRNQIKFPAIILMTLKTEKLSNSVIDIILSAHNIVVHSHYSFNLGWYISV